MPWTASARRQYARPAAGGGPARGARRDPLPAADRLPVAPPAQELPAQEHGLRLLPAPVGGRHVADAPRPAGQGRARAGRAGAGLPPAAPPTLSLAPADLRRRQLPRRDRRLRGGAGGPAPHDRPARA